MRGDSVGGIDPHVSSIDMYNNDGGKKFMKQTGALKAATLYFASAPCETDATRWQHHVRLMLLV